MFDDKIAFIISMYNEFGTVNGTIDAIRKLYGNAIVIVIRSDDKSGNKIHRADDHVLLEDLSDKLPTKHHIPSHALSRNYSTGFKLLYEKYPPQEYIVALTGDTSIQDASGITDIIRQMLEYYKVAGIAQHIGGNFYTQGNDPDQLVPHGRIQGEDTTDIMPQLFIVKGSFANDTKCFQNIEITNNFTSEQCLGDELQKHFSAMNAPFHDLVHRYSRSSSCNTEKIKYHKRQQVG